MSVNRTWGIIAGAGIIIILAVVIWLAVSRGGSRAKYDERQRLARGRAFCVAFWVLVSYNCLLGLYGMITGLQFAEPFVAQIIGVCVSVMVFVLACVFSDAYFAMNQRPRTYLILFGIIVFANAFAAVCSILDGKSFLTDGLLNYRCMNIVIVIMFLILFIALAIRSALLKKEERE